jgi:putative tryptophan/tyrosine transport system substrate-binding protein
VGHAAGVGGEARLLDNSCRLLRNRRRDRDRIGDQLQRPGGNLTGETLITEATVGKQLEFPKEVVASLSGVGALINPTNPFYGSILRASDAPATALNLQLRPIGVTDAGEFDGAFAAAVKDGVEGLIAL